MRNSADIEFDGIYFKLKPAYNVYDKASLKAFMMEQASFGIVDGEKLHLCYQGVMDDMDALIKEGWIREVKITETSREREKVTRVFFPKNLEETDVEFTKEELPDNCVEMLAGLWNQIGDVKTIKWEEVLQKADLLEA